MLFKYNSQFLKKPFGAVATGERVEILFPVFHTIEAFEIRIIIRDDFNYKKVIKLDYKDRDNDYINYIVNFYFEKPAIYYYRFEIDTKEGIFFIGRDENFQAIRGDWLKEWQITVYENNFEVPEIGNGGIIYHIFVDRFNKSGNTELKKSGLLKKWKDDVDIAEAGKDYLADDFFGGNFKGIIEKLDYLKSLNVSLIYLSPIFKASSNHRYDTGDYSKVDELLGNEKDFKNLIEEAKKRGIGIILDGVFNHSGADSVYFNKFNTYDDLGAYQSKQSPYYNWYTFKKWPDIYDGWWGMTCVPTLNKNDESLRKFFLGKDGIIEKWSKMGISGWRLDVVDELPIEYLSNIRKVIKGVNKDILIIGEVWEDASIKVSYSELRPYLNGYQLDGVMNYVFKRAIIDYTLNSNNAKETAVVMRGILENYPKQCLNASMTLLGTHDTIRILNTLADINVFNMSKAQRRDIKLDNGILNKAIKLLKFASVMQYTVNGIPTIYYGDEVGLQGYEDPLNRRPFPWDNINDEILNHYIMLGNIRTKYKEIFSGDMIIDTDSDLLSYLRIDKNGKKIRVILNNTNEIKNYLIEKGKDLIGELVITNQKIEIEPHGYRLFLIE